MLKYIIFFVIFIIKFIKSDSICVININLNTTQYSNNLCGYNKYPACGSIQDGLSSLGNLASTQICSSAQLNLNSGIYNAKDGNYIVLGNYDQLKLNNIQNIQVTGSGTNTIVDGSGVSNNAFFSLSGTSQSLQFNFSNINFENWFGEANLFDIGGISNNSSNILSMNFNSCNFTKIETSSIFYSISLSNKLQFQNVNFKNIFTLFSPITLSTSYIAMIDSSVNQVDNAIPFVNLLAGTLIFYNCSINTNHPMMGEKAAVLFIKTSVDPTTLCHCEDCIYQTSNENSLSPTSVTPLETKCKTKRFWVILVSSIGAVFIIICFIVLFVLNKKFGIIDIGNKKRKTKLRKSYYQDDEDDEQTSIFLNDHHL